MVTILKGDNHYVPKEADLRLSNTKGRDLGQGSFKKSMNFTICILTTSLFCSIKPEDFGIDKHNGNVAI